MRWSPRSSPAPARAEVLAVVAQFAAVAMRWSPIAAVVADLVVAELVVVVAALVAAPLDLAEVVDELAAVGALVAELAELVAALVAVVAAVVAAPLDLELAAQPRCARRPRWRRGSPSTPLDLAGGRGGRPRAGGGCRARHQLAAGRGGGAGRRARAGDAVVADRGPGATPLRATPASCARRGPGCFLPEISI
jgi:hypothetical protein